MCIRLEYPQDYVQQRLGTAKWNNPSAGSVRASAIFGGTADGDTPEEKDEERPEEQLEEMYNEIMVSFHHSCPLVMHSAC
jgi:hypothetical protein